MPNWCSTAYVIEGNVKEVKSLYELMKGLQERKEPSVENGFGISWLGCLVDGLGGDCIIRQNRIKNSSFGSIKV